MKINRIPMNTSYTVLWPAVVVLFVFLICCVELRSQFCVREVMRVCVCTHASKGTPVGKVRPCWHSVSTSGSDHDRDTVLVWQSGQWPRMLLYLAVHLLTNYHTDRCLPSCLIQGSKISHPFHPGPHRKKAHCHHHTVISPLCESFRTAFRKLTQKQVSRHQKPNHSHRHTDLPVQKNPTHVNQPFLNLPHRDALCLFHTLK